jgi:nicotinamide mononucleotide transporter
VDLVNARRSIGSLAFQKGKKMDFSSLISVHTIAFNILGYDISWIELISSILSFLGVFFCAKRKLSGWVFSGISIVMFIYLYYQIHLYGDFALQPYYFVTCVFGIYAWSKHSEEDGEVETSYLNKKERIFYSCLTVALCIGLVALLANLNSLLPQFFPDPDVAPALDGIMMALSLVGQYLMVKGKIESWIIWVVVDTIALWKYLIDSSALFLTILYFGFLVNAVYGLVLWHKGNKSNIEKTT